MNDEIKRFNPIALQCVLNEFSNDDKGFIVIYKTNPYVSLMDILPLMNINNINAWDHYKYNGIPVITMRISHVEYDHYASLYNNYYMPNIQEE
jgi:hypothetical protein